MVVIRAVATTVARRRRRPAEFRFALLAVVQFAPVFDLGKPPFYFLELGGVDFVGRLSWQKLLNFLLRLLYAVGRRRVGFEGLRECSGLLLLLCLDLLEERGEGLRIVAALVHILQPEIIGLGLEPAAELQEGHWKRQTGGFLSSESNSS